MSNSCLLIVILVGHSSLQATEKIPFNLLTVHSPIFSNIHQNFHVSDINDTLKSSEHNTEHKKGKKYIGFKPKSLVDVHGQSRSMIKDEDRAAWIEQNISALKILAHPSDLEEVSYEEVILDDFYQMKYRVNESGILHFVDGSYVVVMTHSAHTNPYIGDIILAKDSKGHMYINHGHICGGIIHFILEERRPIRSAGDFIQYFKSDTDNEPWQIIK